MATELGKSAINEMAPKLLNMMIGKGQRRGYTCGRLAYVMNTDSLFKECEDLVDTDDKGLELEAGDSKWKQVSEWKKSGWRKGWYVNSIVFHELENDYSNTTIVRRIKAVEKRSAAENNVNSKVVNWKTDNMSEVLNGIYLGEQSPILEGLLHYIHKIYDPEKYDTLIIRSDNKAVVEDLHKCMAREKLDYSFKKKPGCLEFRRIVEHWGLRVEIEHIDRKENKIADSIGRMFVKPKFFLDFADVDPSLTRRFVEEGVEVLDGPGLSKVLGLYAKRTESDPEMMRRRKNVILDRNIIRGAGAGKEKRFFGPLEWPRLFAFSIKKGLVCYSSREEVNQEKILFETKMAQVSGATALEQRSFHGHPSVEETISILRRSREYYERLHSVKISDRALVSAAELSHRYFVPDKAIELIEAAARLKNETTSKPNQLDEVDREVLKLEKEKSSLENDTSPYSKGRLKRIAKDLVVLRMHQEFDKELSETKQLLMDQVCAIKEEIDKVNVELEAAVCNHDLIRAIGLKDWTLWPLQVQLEALDEKLARYLKEVTCVDIAEIASRWSGIAVSHL